MGRQLEFVHRHRSAAVYVGYAIALLAGTFVLRSTSVNPFQTQLQGSILAILGMAVIGSFVIVYYAEPDDPLLAAVPAVTSLALLLLLMFWIDSTTTPFGWGHVDISGRVGTAERWARGWWPVDGTIKDQPNWYTPSPLLPTAILIKLGVSPVTAMRIFQIVTTGATPWLVWVSYRHVGTKRLAALTSLSSLVLASGFSLAKPDEFLGVVMAAPLFIVIYRALLNREPLKKMVLIGLLLVVESFLFILGSVAIAFALMPVLIFDGKLAGCRLESLKRVFALVPGAVIGVAVVSGQVILAGIRGGFQVSPQQAYWAPLRKISFLDGLDGHVLPLSLVVVALAYLMVRREGAREGWWWCVGYVWLWAFGAAGVLAGVGVQIYRSAQFFPVVLGFGLAAATDAALDVWPAAEVRKAVLTAGALIALAAMPDMGMFTDSYSEGSRQEGYFVPSQVSPRVDGTYNRYANYPAELLHKVRGTPVRPLPKATNWREVERFLEKECGQPAENLVVLPATSRAPLGFLSSWQWIPYAQVWDGPTVRYTDRLAYAVRALHQKTALGADDVLRNSPFGPADALLLNAPKSGTFSARFSILTVPEGSTTTEYTFDDSLMRFGKVVSGVAVIPLCDLP